MTTPAFAVQSVNQSVSQNGATGANIQCNNLAGTGVNISSGYVAKLLSQSNSNANPATAPLDITSNCSFVYGTTGLLTITFAAALAATLQGLANSLVVLLSNDAGTTEAVVGLGTLSIARNDPNS